GNFDVGANSGGGSGRFDGLIDDVRVYNRALSATEITQLYNVGQAKVAKTPSTGSGQASNPLSLGLVGHWTFDGKDTPGRALDVSGQANHGNLVNMSTSTSRAPGKIGQGLRFDGVNDAINTGSDMIGTGEDSISAWINPRSFALSGNDSRIVTNDKTILTMRSSNSTIGISSNGIALVEAASSAIVLNRWTHVTVTRNSSGTANLYVNGILSGTANQNSGTPSGGSTNVFIGNSSLLTSRPFDGIIDDVRVYNRALSATEITQLYNVGQAKIAKTQSPAPCGSGAPLSCGLVGHWTFDGKDTPGRALDVSGQGNHGNLVAMSTSTSRVPGKIGQGLKFDGVNDYVKISSDIIGTTALTITAWIKPTASTLSVGTGRIVTNGNVTIFKLASSNRLSFTSNNSNTAVSATNALSGTANTWQFISVTRNESGTANIYLNGTLTGTANQNSGSPIVGTDFEIGAQLAASFFDGSIDDVRVYNRALSPTEVQRLYQLGR
ncbi:MAG TPA: LamG-like jellyroll fold domain-containing protein, partial [Candidatus Paceibacterota bacterium]